MRFLYDPIKGLNDNVPPSIDKVGLSQSFDGNAATYAQFGLAGHNGLDIYAPFDYPIQAPCDGWIVEQTSRNTGFGLRITMRSEVGLLAMQVFGHMNRLRWDHDVAYDWNNKQYFVKAGQVIGYVDSTGFSTGNHLHWGFYPMNENGTKTYQTNGYGGAVDQSQYCLNKDAPMSNAVFIKKAGTGEYGFYLPATTAESLKDKDLNLGLDIFDSNGNVDFSKARDVSGL